MFCVQKAPVLHAQGLPFTSGAPSQASNVFGQQQPHY